LGHSRPKCLERERERERERVIEIERLDCSGVVVAQNFTQAHLAVFVK